MSIMKKVALSNAQVLNVVGLKKIRRMKYYH